MNVVGAERFTGDVRQVATTASRSQCLSSLWSDIASSRRKRHFFWQLQQTLHASRSISLSQLLSANVSLCQRMQVSKQMKFINAHNVSKCRIWGARREILYLGEWKGLLEEMSLGFLAESVGTVGGSQNWKQPDRVPDSKRCDREAIRAPNAVRANETVSRLVLDVRRERAGVWKHRMKCKYAGCE